MSYEEISGIQNFTGDKKKFELNDVPRGTTNRQGSR